MKTMSFCPEADTDAQSSAHGCRTSVHLWLTGPLKSCMKSLELDMESCSCFLPYGAFKPEHHGLQAAAPYKVSSPLVSDAVPTSITGNLNIPSTAETV